MGLRHALASSSRRGKWGKTGTSAASPQRGHVEAAESARAFNRELRLILGSLGVSSESEDKNAFVCECGCAEVAELTLREYDDEGGAWLEAHTPNRA